MFCRRLLEYIFVGFSPEGDYQAVYIVKRKLGSKVNSCFWPPEYFGHQNIWLPEYFGYQDILFTRIFWLPDYILVTRIFWPPEYFDHQHILASRIFLPAEYFGFHSICCVASIHFSKEGRTPTTYLMVTLATFATRLT